MQNFPRNPTETINFFKLEILKLKEEFSYIFLFILKKKKQLKIIVTLNKTHVTYFYYLKLPILQY